MIGQDNLIDNIDKTLYNYPRFSIIVGPKGSGKKEIVRYICDRLNLQILSYGQKIEEVREAITTAYEQINPICYMFADADNMSVMAKNCMLKITEEPPRNAYFIITLQSIDNMLDTIRSRATILKLDPYTKQQLIQYRIYRKYNDSFDDLVQTICSTTGDVDELFTNDIQSFYNYANMIVNGIDKVNNGNVFKISHQLKLKDSDQGFNAVLLFRTVSSLFLKRGIQDKDKRYLKAVQVTNKYIQDLIINSLNKQATIDMWIIEVRSVLRENF